METESLNGQYMDPLGYSSNNNSNNRNDQDNEKSSINNDNNNCHNDLRGWCKVGLDLCTISKANKQLPISFLSIFEVRNAAGIFHICGKIILATIEVATVGSSLAVAVWLSFELLAFFLCCFHALGSSSAKAFKMGGFFRDAKSQGEFRLEFGPRSCQTRY